MKIIKPAFPSVNRDRGRISGASECVTIQRMFLCNAIRSQSFLYINPYPIHYINHSRSRYSHDPFVTSASAHVLALDDYYNHEMVSNWLKTHCLWCGIKWSKIMWSCYITEAREITRDTRKHLMRRKMKTSSYRRQLWYKYCKVQNCNNSEQLVFFLQSKKRKTEQMTSR